LTKRVEVVYVLSVESFFKFVLLLLLPVFWPRLCARDPARVADGVVGHIHNLLVDATVGLADGDVVLANPERKR
jgi:hypothetical protein